MTQEELDKKIKKLREKYHETKAETALAAGSRGTPQTNFNNQT
jgi:ribosomal protein L29